MAARRDDDLSNSIDPQALLDGFRRLSRPVQVLVVVLLIVAAIALGCAYLQSQNVRSVAGGSPQMLLGNPSNATGDASNRDNYLMVKPYFALSYNSTKGTPNWVSWQVSAADLGSAPRAPEFAPDTALPPGFNQVLSKDYSGSGFDRGHMCPHSDRGGNQDMSYATFVMTNIIPQAPNVNRKAWEQLESYGRHLVKDENDRIYVASGPSGSGGRGKNGFRQALARGQVTVPAECWKIIVAVPQDGGDDDLAKINANTRVIAVIMPNDEQAVGEEWAGFRTSVAEVERHTGLHFFDRLAPSVAAALRQKVDAERIPPPKPRHYGAE